MKNIIYPVSSQKIDKGLSRFMALLQVLLLTAFVETLQPVFIAVIVADSLVRALVLGKYSPLQLIAGFTLFRLIGLESEKIDLDQKVFAARLVFLPAFAALVLILTGHVLAAMVLANMLLILSLLDFIFGFCLGCTIYHHFIIPFYQKSRT